MAMRRERRQPIETLSPMKLGELLALVLPDERFGRWRHDCGASPTKLTTILRFQGPGDQIFLD